MCTVVSPHPSPGLTPEQFIVGPWSRTSVFIALLTEIWLPVACFPALCPFLDFLQAFKYWQ